MISLDAAAHRRTIVFLLRVALGVFPFTVVVGILNGTDAVDFGFKTILTHVHVGTLGWLTLCVFAVALWLFGDAETTGWRRSAPPLLAYLAAACVVAYNAMFLTTTGTARPAVGAVTGSVMVAFLVWAAAQARTVEMSVPRWGILAALATSVIGAVIGILWGVMLATGDKVLPKDGEGAHPATMVVGFLVPVAMAIAEWWLYPERVTARAPRSGFVQIALLFAGGVTLMVGVLVNSPPLIGLNLPFEIAAIVIFLRRNWPALRSVRWLEASPTRYLVSGSIALVANLALLGYLISKYAEDFDRTPQHLLLALDHLMFVGVITNALFGLLDGATASRRTIWAWADDIVFWCTNIGVTGFVVGLLADTAVPKRIFTPVMGIGILVAIATYLVRLSTPAAEAGVAPSGAVTT